MPAGKVRAPYATQLRAAGRIPFYHWDVIAGALPEGLVLDSFTGEIAGKPSKPGIYGFTVRVRDYVEKGTGVTRRFRIQVAGP